MDRFGSVVVAILTGILSMAAFLIVFAATALPALSIVEDDNAWVTWSVLVLCAFAGWVAARGVQRLIRRTWLR